jgi:hypothetical protein
MLNGAMSNAIENRSTRRRHSQLEKRKELNYRAAQSHLLKKKERKVADDDETGEKRFDTLLCIRKGEHGKPISRETARRSKQ